MGNLYTKKYMLCNTIKRIGPISCFILLTIATVTLTPKAYANINPVSCYICIAFYVLGVVSLVIVTCSDPGIVKREMMCVPRDISEERGWRYCDLCR